VEELGASRRLVGLGPDGLSDLYYHLVLARAAEERLEILFKQGHVKGGLYRSLGQEAVGVGAAYALRRRHDGMGDVLGQTIRTTGAVFLMGGTPLQYFQQYLARHPGPTAGREANVHWCDFDHGLIGPVSPLGTMAEVLAGVALAFKLRGEDRVALVFGGDGQTSTGAWHEGVNFAAIQRCPLVVVVQANQYAFSTPTRKQTRLESFVDKGPGYGLPAESVDGNDVLAVYEATRRAVSRARAGEGGSLIEARTYRRLGHAQHDPQEYVPQDELAVWAAQDPIDRYRQRLLKDGLASEEELDRLLDQAEQTVRVASEAAVADPVPDGIDALADVYVDAGAPVPWTRLNPADPRRH
jgi:pyruvate dehydrogenase E1 component alpha subunit/2-oxoisovalerate dehydrogenase E1 component alpha subunit